MSYAILRFEKRKGSSGQTSGIEKHHERKKTTYHSNPDIDATRFHLNYHLVSPKQRYAEEISNRIRTAGCRVRKDSVRFIDTIVTASSEFLESLTPEERREFFTHAFHFLKDNIGEENIFSAVVHMDEKTPHMHLCFTPITKDGRLSAKEIIGNRAKLVQWQDNFHDHMAEHYSALKRGESASITRRKHIPTWMFKQANKLSEEMLSIQSEIDNIGVLNAKGQKEKLTELFSKWNSSVNSFEGYLKPFGQRIKELESEKSSITATTAEKEKSMTTEIKELTSQLMEWQSFSKSIDNNLWNKLVTEYKSKEQEKKADLLNSDIEL